MYHLSSINFILSICIYSLHFFPFLSSIIYSLLLPIIYHHLSVHLPACLPNSLPISSTPSFHSIVHKTDMQRQSRHMESRKKNFIRYQPYCHRLDLDFQPPGIWENIFPLLQLLNVWYPIMFLLKDHITIPFRIFSITSIVSLKFQCLYFSVSVQSSYTSLPNYLLMKHSQCQNLWPPILSICIQLMDTVLMNVFVHE